MTWATVRGVRVWNHKAFVEPSDDELEQYGWTNPKHGAVETDRGPHVCLDCSKTIHHQSIRCRPCHTARRRVVGPSAEPSPVLTCADCPTVIHSGSSRCRVCHLVKMRADAGAHKGRFKVDDLVVQRILGGDWKLKTTKAEKVAVTAAWLAQGRSQRSLHMRTGWKVERYVQRDVQDVAA